MADPTRDTPPPRPHVDVSALAPEQILRRMELQVVRRLDGLLRGEHLGLLPGPGSELAEARLYQPGEDDVRLMDWNVTARTTVPHVRDLIADRELETWALLDLSASMDFGTAAMQKRDLAVAALAAIGFLTARLGDRFGGYVLHHGGGDSRPPGRGAVRRWPARSGRPALHAMLQAIVKLPHTLPQAADPDLAEALRTLVRAQPKRGLRVVVSDFIEAHPRPGSERAWETPMRRLAVRNQVLAVEIVDPRELELPDVGLVTLTDPETGADREVYLSEEVRAKYAAAAAAQRADTAAALRRCGVPHLVLRTDQDWVRDIARFVMRQRRVAHTLMRHSPGGA